MTTSGPRTLSCQPLVALFAGLKLGNELVENAERGSCDVEVSVEGLRAISPTDLLRAPAAYGVGFTATVWDGDQEALRLDSSTDETVIAAFRGKLRDKARYRLDLDIDKKAVLDALAYKAGSSRILWYLFTSSIGSLIRSGLPAFGETFASPAVVAVQLVVGDVDVLRHGPLLQLIGAGKPNGTPVFAAHQILDVDAGVIDRIQHYGTKGNAQWRQLRLGTLTPLHTSLGPGSSTTTVEHMIDSVTIALCLAWTADRVRTSDNTSETLETWFAGGTATVNFAFTLYSDGEPPNESALIPETVSPGSTKAFVDLVAWCFEVKQDGGGSSWADQRLGFFQVRVAQLLDDADPKQRGETLLRQAGELLASMNGQWRTFIEGRIQGYLDEQKELDELVDVTIRSFGEQSGTLTKSLIDTLLAAVAALIGSTVAAAFKDPFNAGLFRLGMLVYAAYVLLFPAAIGLSVQVGRFRAEQRSYESRRQRFANLLGEHQVNTLEGKRISAAKSSFWFWFWVAVGGFVVAIVGSLVAVLTVPGVIGG